MGKLPAPMKAKITMRRTLLASAVALTFAALVPHLARAAVVTFDDLANGAIVDISAANTITVAAAQFIELGWSGRNELIIANTGMQWAVDNFTFSASPVLEPAGMTLLSLVLCGLGLFRCRRAIGSNLAYCAL
jgi:hypothetical protein